MDIIHLSSRGRRKIMKWPFRRSRTEEIRAETEKIEQRSTGDEAVSSLAPGITSAELLRALIGEKEISRKEAMQIPAIAGSIRLIADIVSALPIKLYRTKDGKPDEITRDARLQLINDDTGDTMTATQFWKAIIRDYYLGKGAYAYINRIGSRIESIHYVDCDEVAIVKSPDPVFKDFRLIVQGKTYEPWDFFILLRNSKDGARGTPIQEENRMILMTEYYAIKFESVNAQKGGSKKGFLQTERQLTEEQITDLKENWKRFFEDNSENMMVLNKGLKYADAQNNPREMQQNENRETNRKEISAIIGVSDAMLTGGATEEDVKNFVKNTLAPLLKDIEKSADRAFLKESEKGDKYFSYDTRELTRGSLKERYEAYEIASRNNIMQLDEIRKQEDLEPLGMNMIKLGLDSVLYDPKAQTIYTPNTGLTQKMTEGRMETIESGTKSGRAAPDGVRERAGEGEPSGDDAEGEGDRNNRAEGLRQGD